MKLSHISQKIQDHNQVENFIKQVFPEFQKYLQKNFKYFPMPNRRLEFLYWNFFDEKKNDYLHIDENVWIEEIFEKSVELNYEEFYTNLKNNLVEWINHGNLEGELFEYKDFLSNDKIIMDFKKHGNEMKALIIRNKMTPQTSINAVEWIFIKISHIFLNFSKYKDFLLEYMKKMHRIFDFDDKFPIVRSKLIALIEESYWNAFKSKQKDCLGKLNERLMEIKKEIDELIMNNFNKNVKDVDSFDKLRKLMSNYKSKLHEEIEKYSIYQDLEIKIPTFIKNKYFNECEIFLEKQNCMLYKELYNKSFSSFKKEHEKFIFMKVYECLQDKKKFIEDNLDDEIKLLLIQISYLSFPKIMDQTLFDEHFALLKKVLSEKLLINLENYQNEMEKVYHVTQNFETYKENITSIESMIKKYRDRYIALVYQSKVELKILILIVFVMSYHDYSEEVLTINLELKNKIKYLIRNFDDNQFSLMNFHIQDFIEKILEELISDEKGSKNMQLENLEIFMDLKLKLKINAPQEEQLIPVIRTSNTKKLDELIDNSLEKISSRLNDEKPNLIKFVRIQPWNVVSRVPTICISGFCSKNCDKTKEWRHLSDHLPFSENISFLWDACTFDDFKDFGLNTASLVINVFASFMKKDWFRIFDLAFDSLNGKANFQNPFEKAYAQALKSGIYLAHMISNEELVKGHGFNLIGFSMGTIVIYSCLQELEKINSLDKINDVIIMGSIIHLDDIKSLKLKSIAGHLINCYSENDDILRYFFRAVKWGQSPVGLQAIEKNNFKILDVDCSDIISGHMDYREKMDVVLRRIDFNSDFYFLN